MNTKGRNLGKLKEWPLLSAGVFLAVMIACLIVQLFSAKMCGETIKCFSIPFEDNRIEDYIILLTADVAVLIPIAIELWREFYISNNYGRKLQLDLAWEKARKRKSLNEPVIGISLFAVLCTVIPLFFTSSAFFYGAVAYGLYVIGNMFYNSFYRKPQNVYDLPELSLPGGQIPNTQLIAELATETMSRRVVIDKKSNSTQAVEAQRPWASQLSDQQTLEVLTRWAKQAFRSKGEKAHEKSSFWFTYTSFLDNCDLNILWLSATDGGVHGLLVDPSFYGSGNWSNASRVLSTIVRRLVGDTSYGDVVQPVLADIPIEKIGRRILQNILNSPLKTVFDAVDPPDFDVNYTLPASWLVTKDNLKSNTDIARVTAASYLTWISRFNSEESGDHHTKAQAITEQLFPEVETIYFAKIVIVRTNLNVIVGGNSAEFKNIIDRWGLFGAVGRMSEFTSFESEEKLLESVREAHNRELADTIEIVRKLSWFNINGISVEMIRSSIVDLMSKDDFEQEERDSWIQFAESLSSFA